MINRNRQRSTRSYVYDEMKWSIRQKSSDEPPKADDVLLNNNNTNSEDANDYRVTVV
jgi:hypothetical protein